LQDVLYFFWVKQAACPHCESSVDLFPTRIVARNADPARKPEVQVCCPQCGDIFAVRRRDAPAHCPSCRLSFDPCRGTAAGTKAKCPKCAGEFAIAQAVRGAEGPPSHRLYAKLLLYPDGTKRYLPGTDDDYRAYLHCSQLLADELARGAIRLPSAVLCDGYNTRQAIGYNYRCWRDFFNDRQLLALSWLQEAISHLPDPSTRDAMLTLFSGLLEFNNLFASYKGEGTGAVRHMFSHHILKPERLPIEANVWGTPKSSGSFRNLFAGRLLRAIEYREAPFEVRDGGEGKVYPGGETFSGRVETVWPPSGRMERRAIYLSCGSSDATGLPDRSVDVIVTDPPFFDNVHYSELADFFHAWQSLFPRGFIADQPTTRHPREVQDTEAGRFADKLGRVFTECKRVLKDDGLLVFTYHHSREEGWTSLVQAIYEAGFSVAQAHPVKAEMSVATPKSQAKEPIQLDVIFVCRKRTADCETSIVSPSTIEAVAASAREKLLRLRGLGLALSLNDCRVTVTSQFLKLLRPANSPEAAVEALSSCRVELDHMAKTIFREAADTVATNRAGLDAQQLSLFSAID
jgi:putative DNA methylase